MEFPGSGNGGARSKIMLRMKHPNHKSCGKSLHFVKQTILIPSRLAAVIVTPSTSTAQSMDIVGRIHRGGTRRDEKRGQISRCV